MCICRIGNCYILTIHFWQVVVDGFLFWVYHGGCFHAVAKGADLSKNRNMFPSLDEKRWDSTIAIIKLQLCMIFTSLIRHDFCFIDDPPAALEIKSGPPRRSPSSSKRFDECRAIWRPRGRLRCAHGDYGYVMVGIWVIYGKSIIPLNSNPLLFDERIIVIQYIGDSSNPSYDLWWFGGFHRHGGTPKTLDGFCAWENPKEKLMMTFGVPPWLGKSPPGAPG